MNDTSSASAKGLRRTYGRGSGAYATDDAQPDASDNGGPERRDAT